MEHYKIITLIKYICFLFNIFCFLQKTNSTQIESPKQKNDIPPQNSFSKSPFQNINPLEIEYETSNLDNNYFVISTKDGNLHLFEKMPLIKKKWTVNLGEELIRTHIIRKNIINENKVLIPMDGKLFIVTNQPDIKLEEFAIPITDLVNRSPFSLYFMPNYLFRGNKVSNLFTIDIESGNVVQDELIFYKNYKNNNNKIINVFRDDYTLICLKNNEQVWNTTVSEIIIVNEGSYNEMMIGYDYMKNNLNNFDIDINQNEIISIHDYDNKRHFPVKIYEQNHATKTTDTSFFGRYDDGYFFYSEWDYDDEKIKKSMNSFRKPKKKKKIFNLNLRYIFLKLYEWYYFDYFFIFLFIVYVCYLYIYFFMKGKKNNNVKFNKSIKLKEDNKVEQKKTEDENIINAKQEKLENKIEPSQQKTLTEIPKITNQNIITPKKEIINNVEEKEKIKDKSLEKKTSLNLNSNGIWDVSNSESSDSSNEIITLQIIQKNQINNNNNKDNNSNILNLNIKKEEEEKKENDLNIDNKLYTSRGITRLERDFKEFEKLGKGGFGCVLKARHKIDDKINAIKIVKLENLNEQNVIREAQTMTKIHSEHIVEYKSCWFDASLGSLESLVNDSESEEEESEDYNNNDFSKSYSKKKNHNRYLKKIDENEDEDKDDISNLLNYKRSGYYYDNINNIENIENNNDSYKKENSFNYRSSSHSHSNSQNSNEPSIVFCDNDNKKSKSIIFDDNTIKSKESIIFEDSNNKSSNSIIFGDNTIKSKDSIIFTDSNNVNNENNNNINISGRYKFQKYKKENYSSQNLSFNSMKNDRNSFSPTIEISRKKFKSKTDLVNFPYLLNLFDDNYIAKKIYEEPNSDTERSNNKTKKNKKKQKINIDFRDDTSKSITRKSKISLKETPKFKTYFFIQMEFCEGLTLRQYIDNNIENGLNENTIFIFTYQLLKSLKKIHEHNIIHRDIKPDNIFVINNNSIKIGDFGLATEMKEIKKEKGSKNNLLLPHNRKSSSSLIKGYNESCLEGTPIYISPEQLERKSINEKVDIYALGLVLYEMCGCFLTQMERRKSLENLKLNRIIVDKVLNKFPIQSKLILKMTERNARIRPNAKGVLKSEEFIEWKEERKNNLDL